MVFVGHEEVSLRMIKPSYGWKRYEYMCNGHLQYIYCLNKKTFIALFEEWSRCSIQNGYVGRYTYTLTGKDGVDMSLEDIIMDRPEGSEFRVKVYLTSHQGEYIQ